MIGDASPKTSCLFKGAPFKRTVSNILDIKPKALYPGFQSNRYGIS